MYEAIFYAEVNYFNVKEFLFHIDDPERHKNLTIYSLSHCQSYLKISCKSVWKFLRKVANKQTDRQTDKQRRKHNLLGGGNRNLSRSLRISFQLSLRNLARRQCVRLFLQLN